MKKILLILMTLCSGFLFSKTGLAKKDSNFVRMAVEHTLFEVKLAQLAQNKASTPEVKALSSTLLEYHTKALGELKSLAGQKNITVATGLSEKSQKYYDKFSKKDGMDFDKMYTKCAAKTHKWGACALKKESKKGKDAEIKSWSATNYPQLEQLRDKAKETCKTLKTKK